MRTSRSARLGVPADTGGEINTAGEGAGGNPFSWGQCTYYAYERRGDIVETAAAKGIPRGGPVPGEWIAALKRNAYVWDAYRWTGNAQRAGIPTGGTPIAGAVAVFPKGYGGSPVGHVAYVESVSGGGSYWVTERNWNWNPNVQRRLVRPAPGVTFIYGGPAGNPGQGAPGPVPPPPVPAPPAPAPPQAPNRTAVTSYNRMQPGAPHHGVFAWAWQPFTAQSNTITTLGATVGKPGYAGGLNMLIRLCANQPDASGNCSVIGQTSPAVVNYGNSQGDIGNVAVTPGATYWIQFFPPQPYGNGWVAYWWAGGSTISTSDQVQAIVLGYNR